MNYSGDDIHIPEQDLYEIETFLDSSMLTHFRSPMAGAYSGFIEHYPGSGHTSKRKPFNSSENV